MLKLILVGASLLTFHPAPIYCHQVGPARTSGRTFVCTTHNTHALGAR
jgi:hypothetical protein